MSLSRCCVVARVPPHPEDALRWVGPELQPRGAWCLYAASIAATITALAAALAAASTATSTSLILARRCSQVLVSASGVCAASWLVPRLFALCTVPVPLPGGCPSCFLSVV